jgi:dinuclear metal center YbgI/SA1388 family protein
VTTPKPPTLASVVGLLDDLYPPAWAQEWDRVGLVVGEPEAPIRRILCVVDCVPQTVDEAIRVGADLIVAHHPLLLRGVSSVATTTYQGRIVHDLIRHDIGLYTAHTNADVAVPGVSDALAARLRLQDLRPLVPATGAAAAPGRGIGRIGRLVEPLTLRDLTEVAARLLPQTAWGVRAAGEPDRWIETLAVCGGAGDAYLAQARSAGVDAYLTADLRHHPASEHLSARGPALLDAAHWATERPWLDEPAAVLHSALAVETIVSDIPTDVWTLSHRGGP